MLCFPEADRIPSAHALGFGMLFIMRSIADVARVLDHAVLKPEFSAADMAAHARMCIERGVGCLCVRSCDVAEAVPAGAIVKVILETCYLAPAEIRTACQLAEEAGADFVKTSTGFGVRASGPTGATPDAVRIMLETVGDRLEVKASGGIRTWADAVAYLDLGCTRLGVGDAAAILDGRPVEGDY